MTLPVPAIHRWPQHSIVELEVDKIMLSPHTITTKQVDIHSLVMYAEGTVALPLATLHVHVTMVRKFAVS